jgi:putative transposase
MKPYIYELTEAKRRCHYQVSPEEAAKGFRGWHSRGYLPHFDAPGTQQFLTWRLADSLPESRRGEWEHLLRIENEREKQIQLEAYLDKGRGSCVLRRPEVAQVVEQTLLFDDGRGCRLLAWVVMPNHVHLLVEVWQTPLSKLIQTWKTLTGKRANALLGRSGQLWQEEYRDRYMRDEEHYRKTVRYIENNPTKARLVRAPADWRFSSAWWRAQDERGGARTPTSAR